MKKLNKHKVIFLAFLTIICAESIAADRILPPPKPDPPIVHPPAERRCRDIAAINFNQEGQCIYPVNIPPVDVQPIITFPTISQGGTGGGSYGGSGVVEEILDQMDNYNNNREGYNIGGGNGGRAGGRDVLRRSREY